MNVVQQPLAVQLVKSSLVELQKKSGTKIGLTGCLIRNLGTMIEELDITFYEAEDDKVVIDGKDIIPLLRLIWANVQEGLLECTGKTVKIDSLEFGDSITSNVSEKVVGMILKLLLEKK